jgi:Holliday junction resolvase-like predicted endonuclease
MSSAKIVKVGNIGPNQGYPIGMLTLPNDVDMANYEIDIFARNGRVMQFVQYKKLNDNWIKAAEKILFHNKTIKKYIDKNFSKDQESKSFLE